MAFLSYGKPLAAQIDKKPILGGLGREQTLNKVVFLAHSSKDKACLRLVEEFFKSFDAGIYPDEGDKNLPVIPAHQTVQMLKGNIFTYPRLVILVSPNSKDSNWIPWELGLADGLKGVSKVALLPITPDPDGEEWALQEHLGLYPLIYLESVDGSMLWRVYDPKDKKAWKLKFWLHSNLT